MGLQNGKEFVRLKNILLHFLDYFVADYIPILKMIYVLGDFVPSQLLQSVFDNSALSFFGEGHQCMLQ